MGEPRQGALEQLQIPLGAVRDRLGIEGMGEAAATRFRDKAVMKDAMRRAGLPCARHRATLGVHQRGDAQQGIGEALLHSRNADLAAMARNNLRNAGIHNVEVRQADGAKASAVDGSFDVIAMSGSVTEIPHSLLGLLKVGGRLGAIVGDEPIMRATIVTRVGESQFRTQQPWDTVAPRLLNFPEPSRFSF